MNFPDADSSLTIQKNMFMTPKLVQIYLIANYLYNFPPESITEHSKLPRQIILKLQKKILNWYLKLQKILPKLKSGFLMIFHRISCRIAWHSTLSRLFHDKKNIFLNYSSWNFFDIIQERHFPLIKRASQSPRGPPHFCKFGAISPEKKENL